MLKSGEKRGSVSVYLNGVKEEDDRNWRGETLELTSPKPRSILQVGRLVSY